MAPKYLAKDEPFRFPAEFGFTGSAQGRHDAMNHPADADDNEYGDGSFVEKRPALAKEPGMARGGPIRRALGGDVDPSNPSQYQQPTQMARGGRGKAKGYQDGGPAMPMPTGRPTGVPTPIQAPGRAPGAGPMAAMPPPQMPSSPLAQGADGGPMSRATMTIPVHDAARLAHGLVQAGRLGGIRQAVGNAAAARGAAQARMAALAPAAAPPAPVAQQGVPGMAQGGVVSADNPNGWMLKRTMRQITVGQDGIARDENGAIVREPDVGNPQTFPERVQSLKNERSGNYGMDTDPRTTAATDAINRATAGGYARGGPARTKNFHPGGEKGKLHRELGVAEGQKIPTERLAQAAHSNNPEVRRDAIRAQTMKRWHH